MVQKPEVYFLSRLKNVLVILCELELRLLADF